MKNLIGRNWCDSSNKEVTEVFNPANNALIDTVPKSTVEDVELCVKEAKEGQKNWEKYSIHERGEILYKFRDLVMANKDYLAKLLSDETGKPINEAIAEVNNINVSVPAFIEQSRHMYGNVVPAGTEAGQEKTIQITKVSPVGVIAAIIPFNFPLDLFGQKVPPALLMGNSVIIKPSSSNPLTITKLVELLIEAGVPYGAVQIIHGSGSVVGQALSANKGVNLVSLTGSTSAGIQTMATCANNVTHVMLELGGNDAFILDKDGDVDLAVEEVMWGRMYNTGQVCCASKRFLIHNDVKEEFTRKLLERLSHIKVGDPASKDSDMGCLISEHAAQVVEEQVNKTVAAGAKLLMGGLRHGAFYLPTVITDVTRDMEVMKDMEIFGPVVPILGFDNIDEAIEIANQSSFGLCGNIFTRDMKNAVKVADALECGGVVINGASFYRSFEMPFGGWKYSGMGNEGVMTTLKEMSHMKTIVLKNILD